MPLTRQQLAEVANLLDLYAARAEQISQETAAAVVAAYLSKNFYSPAVVAEIAEQAADLSNTANLVAAGLTTQYLTLLVSQLTGSAVGVPNIPLPPIRNGVDLRKVYQRPVKLFRRKVSEGMPPAEAFEQAMRLAQGLTTGNITLAKRDMSREVMMRLQREIGITGWRRVVRPELSETGTCGLCIAASDQVYKSSQLMPLHDNCKCEPMPIVGALDPGNSLNQLSFKDLYGKAAGDTGRTGTASRDLKRTRWTVNTHGEWGPVLTVKGQKFRGPDELAAITAA